MTRVIFWTLITLSLSFNLVGQAATTPEQFFAQVQIGEPAHVQFDQLVSALFLEERIPSTFYFETMKRNDDWFFLGYFEQYEQANQLLCQCELEELQLYFSIMEQQYRADEMWGIFATDTLGQDFKAKNCLVVSQLPAFLPPAPVIEQYLNGQLPPPMAAGDPFQAEVKAQMIRREDGHWILDLSGQIPDSLQILEIKNPQLHYLSTDKMTYYPTAETADWQADLIKNGHYAAQLYGYPEATWENDLGKYRSFPVENPQQEWNVQFNMRAADEQPTGLMKAIGSVGILVSNGQIEQHLDSLEWFEAGTSYDFKLTEMGSLVIKEAESNSILGYGIFSDSYWQSAAFLNEFGDTLAQFTHDQEPTSVTIPTKSDLGYQLVFTTMEKRQIRIPFQNECSSEELAPLFSLGEAHFKRYNYEIKSADRGDGYQVSALYDVFAPHHSSKDSFRLTAAYDDTGKNLLLAQADSIDIYNRNIEAFGDDAPWWMRPLEDHWRQGFSWEEHTDGDPRPHYHLEVRLWDSPRPTASAIYLAGELHYQAADGSQHIAPWQDSLTFGLRPPVMDEEPKVITKPMESNIAAYRYIIGDAYSSRDQGLEAYFDFPVPADHSYVQMDKERSKLLYLMDDTGHDLLELDRQMGYWNRERAKSLLKPSSSTYRNVLANQWGTSRTNIIPEVAFIIQTRTTPTPGATQAIGQVEVVYDCVAEQGMQVNSQSIAYEKQELITLEVDGHFVEFERFIITEMDGIKYRGYNLKTENQTAFVIGAIAQDGDEMISPNPEKVDYDVYNLYIPEDLDDRQLTINLLYLEMHQHEEVLDIEISMKGTLGQ